MILNCKKSQKILKVLFTRNPNCSGQAFQVIGFFYVTFFASLLISGIQFLFSFFGGYIFYRIFSVFSEEKIQNLVKRAKVVALLLFILGLGNWLLIVNFLDKISLVTLHLIEPLIFLLPVIFSISFGFLLGISFWNLKIFQKSPKLRFIFLPLIIWWGMFLYALFFSPYFSSFLKDLSFLEIIEILGIIGGIGSFLMIIVNLISWEIYQRFYIHPGKFILFLFIALGILILIFGTILSTIIIGGVLIDLIKSKIGL